MRPFAAPGAECKSIRRTVKNHGALSTEVSGGMLINALQIESNNCKVQA